MKYLPLIVMMFASFAVAHEDHDHGPVSVKPKIPGAQIKGNEDALLEVTYSGKQIRIYPFTREQKPIEPSQMKLSATIELPRKKAEPVALRPEKDCFVIDFDPKNAHRITLAINMGGAHGDILKYTIEPKK
jgi:hypothetical protein